MLHLFNQTKIASISSANSIFQVYGPVQTWYLHSSSEIPSQVDSFKLACSKNIICVPVDQMLFLPSELTHVSDPVPLNVETLRTCVGAFRPVLNTDHLGWDHLGEMLIPVLNHVWGACVSTLYLKNDFSTQLNCNSKYVRRNLRGYEKTYFLNESQHI